MCDTHRSLAPVLGVWAAAPRGGTEDRHLGDWVAYSELIASVG
ncbi:hypothetical protein ABTX77_24355 [Streptomyces sp. NPDC097704]